MMCQLLQVSRSGFYAWRDRPISHRGERIATLTDQIRQAHQSSRGTYGSPRITMELKAQKVAVCENTVAKYMKEAGIRSKIKRPFVPCTTESNHRHPVAENLLDRNFTAPRPNTRWTCDITYLWTEEGWLYLAIVMDLFSRRIVGWNMADHLRSELVDEALRMALEQRRPADDGNLLHHSDRGVQYACTDYQNLLKEQAITCSMSRRGNCYDNAVTESFFASLKTEHVHHQKFKTRQEAASSVFEWIEVFYNRQRRHSSLGYLSPEAFEAQIN
jgi:transposase InsO family protein